MAKQRSYQVCENLTNHSGFGWEGLDMIVISLIIEK